MKYYTKNWYKKMQVESFLLYPETEQEWKDNILSYERYGIDIIKEKKEQVELFKEDLLKFLPYFFHPYIENGDLNTKYPSLELKKEIDIWVSQCRNEENINSNCYLDMYAKIKNKLPKKIVNICDKTLHDSYVESTKYIKENSILVIMLNTKQSLFYNKNIKLVFTGVKEVCGLDKLINAYWLNEEVYLHKEGFELNVLFDCPLSEFKIVAENMYIRKYKFDIKKIKKI